MVIETKYNLVDEVWCLIKGKPFQMRITTYKFEGGNLICGVIDDMYRYFGLFEHVFYPTKEDLLKSL